MAKMTLKELLGRVDELTEGDHQFEVPFFMRQILRLIIQAAVNVEDASKAAESATKAADKTRNERLVHENAMRVIESKLPGIIVEQLNKVVAEARGIGKEVADDVILETLGVWLKEDLKKAVSDALVDILGGMKSSAEKAVGEALLAQKEQIAGIAVSAIKGVKDALEAMSKGAADVANACSEAVVKIGAAGDAASGNLERKLEVMTEKAELKFEGMTTKADAATGRLVEATAKFEHAMAMTAIKLILLASTFGVVMLIGMFIGRMAR